MARASAVRGDQVTGAAFLTLLEHADNWVGTMVDLVPWLEALHSECVRLGVKTVDVSDLRGTLP